MKPSRRSLALALVAAFAIAGCGKDNNDNGDDGPSTTPVRTSTPAPLSPTVTVTPGTVVPTVTATSGTAGPATVTPTPTPTPTGACEGPALTSTITTLTGSVLDTGWTGISHNSEAPHDSVVSTDLNCVGDECVVDGTSLVGEPLGAPIPLSAGGVSACVVNRFREAVTGTYNCTTGCGAASAKLLSRVFLVQNADMPCPPCVGDPTPNDGVKGGTCSGGRAPDAPCDVGAITDLFQNANGAPPDAGMTSNDCIPSGSSVGELEINLDPLTTGTVSVNASEDCLGNFPPGVCYCPGQVQPNACLGTGGLCPASGVCENGPVDGVCSGQTFRGCKVGSGTANCEEVFTGAGSCEAKPRPCFGNTITRTGVCGTSSGTLVSIFCIPPTDTAPAINTTAGLPGPGAVELNVSQVRTPRP